MAKRKVGRPKGSKSKKTKKVSKKPVTGCKNVTAYVRRKGRIKKINGVNKKTCLK